MEQKIISGKPEFGICKLTLEDMIHLEEDSKDEYATTLGIRHLPYDLNINLDYTKLAYKRLLHKNINICPIECAIIWFGVNRLLKTDVFNEWTRTREFLMDHPEIRLQKRFRASANDVYTKPYLNPFSTKSARKHYMDIQTAKKLGHLCDTHKINIYYLYPIAHLYGQIIFIEALDKIPNQDVYESIKGELTFFEDQIEEELDIKKIMYKLFSKSDDGHKILDIINKPLSSDKVNNECSKITTKTENCSKITTNNEKDGKIKQLLNLHITEGLDNIIGENGKIEQVKLNTLLEHLKKVYPIEGQPKYPEGWDLELKWLMREYDMTYETAMSYIKEVMPI